MRDLTYVSSRYMLFVLLVENAFFCLILLVGLFALVSGHVIPGLIACFIASLFSWITLKDYHIIKASKSELSVKPIFRAKQIYKIDSIKALIPEKGYFLIVLNSGKRIPIFDSYWSRFPILIFGNRRLQQLKEKLQIE